VIRSVAGRAKTGLVVLSPRAHWVQALGLFAAVAPACTKSTETAPTTAESPMDEPAPAKPVVPSLAGANVEIVIVQRSYVGWGSALRIALAGERGMLYAGVRTPLSAGAEANDVLTVELATAPGSKADHPKGALEIDGVTYPVVSFTGWLQPADTVSHDTLVGVWRVPKAARERWTPGVKRSPGVPQFAYDGRWVVLQLFTQKDWMWKTKDDHYKLETRWEQQPDGGEALQYRAPFGTWETLASMAFEGKGRRFVLAESDTTWPLERVRKPADGNEDELILVQPRTPHDYTTKPMDPSP
jgi:hypothetical protein